MEPKENEDELLRVVNFIKLEDIISDQEKNEEIKKKKQSLKHKDKIYYKNIKKERKL